MYKNNYEVNITVNGKPVREFFHQGKFFVEAREKSEYSIKLKNHSHKKIMAIFSVDGVEVLKGKTATDADSGYIINPYSHVVINGYRIDDDNVATFRFDDGKKSYATQVEYKFDKVKLDKVEKGELAPAKNNGVIGVRIYEEKEPKLIPDWKIERYNNKSKYYIYSNNNINITRGLHLYSGISQITGCSFGWSGSIPLNIYASGYQSNNVLTTNCTTTPAPQFNNGGYVGQININSSLKDGEYLISQSAYNSMDVSQLGQLSSVDYIPNFSVGTTWGNQIEDKVIKVTFEKADTFIDLELFYLNKEELIKLGVDLSNDKKVFISGYPKAFEGKTYCKKPTNWRNK